VSQKHLFDGKQQQGMTIVIGLVRFSWVYARLLDARV
jgi:hypothetical protein